MVKKYRNMSRVQENKNMRRLNSAFVAFGANLASGEFSPRQNVLAAIETLRERTGGTIRSSRLWRTPAFPPGAGPDFVNAVVALEWEGSPRDLLALLHEIEEQFGRRRNARWEARIMDLDLLAFGNEVLPDREEFLRWAEMPAEKAAGVTPVRLVLPHPRMAERGFVLAPLAEVAPDWRHPVFGGTVAEMLADLPAEALAGVVPLGPED